MSLYGRIRAMLIASAALALVGAGITPVVAQQGGTVQGTVVDAATGRGLAGVQVAIAGTNVRGGTNAEGEYRLSGVPAGTRTITATRVGYSTGTQTIAVAAGGAATANFRLAASAVELEGLVVTALGITREERAIPNAVQSVSGAELVQARETNLVNALSGKVSGVTITNAGPQGGSSRIVIRGANSLLGNNQPLFVVDGVPIDNTASQPFFRGFGGVDYGNAAQDINPNDIEQISVLKGPNAAALYGSRAANGVILITTKTGRAKAGLGVSASQNITFETPLRLPSYQNEFAQGSGGEFDYVDGNYGGVKDGTDESWGPRLNAGIRRRQFFSNGDSVPLVSSPNNIRNFFDTGRTFNTNVALSGSSDKANMRLSVSRMDQEGMYPGMELNRTTAAFNGGITLTDRLSANGTAQYIASEGEGRPGTGYDGDNPMLQFVWFGRQVDTDLLQRRRTQEGGMYNWNYSYHSNPYWIALENRNFDNRDRLIGNASVSYQFAPWLTGTVRSGTDFYQDRRMRTYAAGTIGVAPGPNGEDVGENGSFDETILSNREVNTDFLLSANRELTSAISLSASFGGNRRDARFDRNYDFVQNLTVPGLYNLQNAATPIVPGDLTSEKRVNSLYGQAQFGFNDYLFVDVTGRNDWSSTLPAEHNSYFYPSVSASLVFTDALNLPSIFSFGKLRASWARVGNDADPYQLASVYGVGNPWNGQSTFTVGNQIANAQLRPEQTESIELGTEMRFVGNRVGLDFTYYDKSTTDQILPVQISPTSGYLSQVVNAGEVRNTGIELLANLVPVRTEGGFEWEVTANFARNRNKVVALYNDLRTVVIGGYWSASIQAPVGEPYGQIYGNPYLRAENGQLLLDDLGRPQRSLELVALGNYNPDWTGGLNNQFRFRGLDFSFLFDTKQGGEIFSMTNNFGRYAGVVEETLKGRCVTSANVANANGLPVCDANTGIVVEGVRVVNGQNVPNDRVITSEQYNKALYRITEAHVFDASFIKLREMRLGYTLPTSMTRRIGVDGLSVAAVGRNLWLKANVPHIDPETAFDASNVQGIEFGQLPSARSIGLFVSVTP